MRSALIILTVLSLVVALPVSAQETAAACTGWIAVESTPIPGAALTVDGQTTGKRTPVTLKGIPCGSHVIQGHKDLYAYTGWTAVQMAESSAPFGKQAVVVVSSETVARVKLHFRPAFGHLSVATRPAGALIELDGVPIGKSPFEKKIAAGKHTLVATLPDHHDASKTFAVQTGGSSRVSLTLRPTFGTIRITAAPADGSEVFLNDDPVGTAPVTLERIWSGFHRIRVEKEGYLPYLAGIMLEEGGSAEVHAALQPRVGKLMVDVEPYGAVVTLDGRPVGRAPLSLDRVPVGHHVLIATLDGKSVERKVIIREGQRTVAELDLGSPLRSSVQTGDEAAAPAPSGPVGSSALPSVSTAAERPMSLRRQLAWVSAGTAAATLVASATLFGMGASTERDADALASRIATETNYNRRAELQSTVRDLDHESSMQYTAGWICAGVFVATAGVSLYLFLSEDDPEERAMAVGLNPLPGGGGVTFSGSF